jgi:DNA-binding transcriptional ArsR family regulator
MIAQMLDSTFSALADPTRRAILAALAKGRELNVGEIAAPFGISLPAISKHLDVLEDAGLLKRAKRGRMVMCVLEPEPMEAAIRWLSDYEIFWTLRLDALTAYLEGNPWQKPKTSRSALSVRSKPRRKKSFPRGRNLNR